MDQKDIQCGRYYRIRIVDLPERTVRVDWSCPADDPTYFYSWDVDTGAGFVLIAKDFLCPCDDEDPNG